VSTKLSTKEEHFVLLLISLYIHAFSPVLPTISSSKFDYYKNKQLVKKFFGLSGLCRYLTVDVRTWHRVYLHVDIYISEEEMVSSFRIKRH